MSPKLLLFAVVQLLTITLITSHRQPDAPTSSATFTHFASIRRSQNNNPAHFISGTILNAKWILTVASHLPADIPVADDVAAFHAVVGLADDAHDGTAYAIAYHLRHAKYNAHNGDNNIALMRTREPIQMNERVQPIALAAEEIDEAGFGAVVGYPVVSRRDPLFTNLTFYELDGITLVYLSVSAKKI